MNRVLIISPTSEWGGPEAGLLEMIRHIDKDRFAMNVIFPAPGPYTEKLKRMGIAVHIIKVASLEKKGLPWRLVSFGPELITSALRVAAMAKHWKADLIFTNCSASIAGLLAAQLIRRPHVAYVREIWKTPKIVTTPLFWYLYNKSTKVATVSHSVKQQVFGHYDPEKIQVIYDCLDPSWFTPIDKAETLQSELGLKPNQPVVCTIARLSPQKGIHCFIEAASLVHEQYPDTMFLIIGDIPRPHYQPYKDRLTALAREKGIEDAVRFLGWRSDVKQLLSLCTANVLASTEPEAAGRVIPEGWAVGVPAIVADHTGPAEIVRDKIDGLHFRAGNSSDLATKINYLLSEPYTRTMMQQNGKKRALELFEAQKNARTMEILWEHVIRESAK
jgi:glycosyltransferase involved in cell wall biosynthesis